MGLGGLREGLGRERDRSEIEPVAGTQRAAHVLIRSHCFALSGERWRAGDAAGSIAGSEAGSAAGSAASGGTGAIGECGARGEESLRGVRGPSDPI